MSAPFATASASCVAQADAFNELKGTVPQLSGSGLAVDQINENLAAYETFLTAMSDAYVNLAEVCTAQADADSLLLAPVSYQDYKRQWDAYRDAVSSGDDDRIEEERTLFEECKATRDAKVVAHAGESQGNAGSIEAIDVPELATGAGGGMVIPRAAGGFNDEDPTAQTPKGDEQGTPSQTLPSESSATPRVSDTSDPARTRVSSDGGTVAGVNPSLSPTANPAMMGQTPQGGTSPTMSGQGGMNPVTAQHLNGSGNKSPKPNLSSMSSNSAVKEAERRRREQRNRDRDKMSEGEMNALIGGVPVPIDRGVSVQGVSTDKDISGRGGTTNLSAGGQQPNTPNSNNPNNQNPRMGGGMMGGAGAMGAGNNASNIKPRDNATPAAFADRDLLGFQSVRDGVDGGRVENATSENPDFDKWSGSVSLLDNPDKDKGKGK